MPAITLPTALGSVENPKVKMIDIMTAMVSAPAKLPTNTRPQFFSTPPTVTPGRRSIRASGVSMNTPVSRSKPSRYSMQNPTGNRMAPMIG